MPVGWGGKEGRLIDHFIDSAFEMSVQVNVLTYLVHPCGPLLILRILGYSQQFLSHHGHPFLLSAPRKSVPLICVGSKSPSRNQHPAL